MSRPAACRIATGRSALLSGLLFHVSVCSSEPRHVTAVTTTAAYRIALRPNLAVTFYERRNSFSKFSFIKIINVVISGAKRCVCFKIVRPYRRKSFFVAGELRCSPSFLDTPVKNHSSRFPVERPRGSVAAQCPMAAVLHMRLLSYFQAQNMKSSRFDKRLADSLSSVD